MYVQVCGMPNIFGMYTKECKMEKWYLCLCVCMCLCVFVSVCGVPNIKLVKCKNGICLCVPVSVYVHVSVCGMPLINLVSLACLPMSPKVQNVNFFKNS